MHNDSINHYYEVDKKDIAYIVSLIEAYDNLAVVRTLDQGRGLIEMLISPDFIDDVNELTENLKKEISIRKIDLASI